MCRWFGSAPVHQECPKKKRQSSPVGVFHFNAEILWLRSIPDSTSPRRTSTAPAAHEAKIRCSYSLQKMNSTVQESTPRNCAKRMISPCKQAITTSMDNTYVNITSASNKVGNTHFHLFSSLPPKHFHSFAALLQTRRAGSEHALTNFRDIGAPTVKRRISITTFPRALLINQSQSIIRNNKKQVQQNNRFPNGNGFPPAGK